MKKGVLALIGLVLIFLGALGILLALNGKSVGYVISTIPYTLKITGETTFNESGKISSNGSVELSEIGEVIAREGKKEGVILNVENNGNLLLNNCRLISKGETDIWISSSQIQSIPSGENAEFIFDVNIPEETEQKDYQAEILLNCEEHTFSKEFIIAVVDGLKAVEIKEVKEKNKILNISYTFDNTDFIGESALVEIWIENSDKVEVKRIVDIFPINKDNLIERNVLINLKEQPTGVYSIYFALSSELNDYLKKSFVIGKSLTTGEVVFKVVKGKGTPYLIFLLVIGLGVFFVFRSHRESLQEGHDEEHI